MRVKLRQREDVVHDTVLVARAKVDRGRRVRAAVEHRLEGAVARTEIGDAVESLVRQLQDRSERALHLVIGTAS